MTDAASLRARILAGIAANDPSDDDLEAVFPRESRKRSRAEWTPAAVCLAAARWLAPHREARVLDIGSGNGKLCLMGALATGGAFTGVERDAGLVALARTAARDLRAERLRFIQGDAFALDWSSYDGLYLFNPFGGSEEEFVAAVRATESRLATAKIGTRVAVYYGFGGHVPTSYGLEAEQRFGGGRLELWLKRS